MSNSTDLTIRVKGDTEEMVTALSAGEKQLENFKNATISVMNKLDNKWNQAAAGIAVYGTALSSVSGAIQQFIISPLSGAVNAFVEFGDKFAKTSQRVGMSAETLGGIKFAAEQCGAGFDEAVDAVKTFQEQLGAARLGDAGAIGKLGAVGIHVADFEGLDSEAQFLKLADHIAAIGDRAQQTRTAIELFGDAGFRLLPFFQEGSEGIKKLMAEGKEIGAVLGNDAANGAAALGDSMNRMKTSCANVSNLLMSQLAPAMTSLFNTISTVVTTLCKMKVEIGILVAVLGTSGLYMAISAMIPVLISFAAQLWVSATAAGGLSAALTLLKAHPAILGITLISAAAIGLYEAFIKVKRVSYEYAKEAVTQAEAFNKLADADQKRIDRLRELEEISKTDTLNNSEVEEATRLVDELSGRYSTLGIRIDATTGKIEGMTTAQQKFLEAMKAEKIRLAESVVLEKRQNVTNRKKELDALVAENDAWLHSGMDFTYNTFYRAGLEQDIRSADDEFAKAQNEYGQAQLDLQALQGVPPSEEAETSTEDLTTANRAARAEQEEARAQKEQEDAAARAEQEEARKDLAARNVDTDLMDPLEKAFAELAEKVAEKYRTLEEEIELARKAGDDAAVAALQSRYAKITQWEASQREKIQADEVARQNTEADKQYQAWQAANPTQPDLVAVPSSDPRLADAQAAVESAKNEHAEAVLSGDSDKIATAAESLKQAEADLARTVAIASGEDRKKAREELGALQQEYSEKQAAGADNATLNALAERIATAQQNVEKHDAEYFNAIGRVETGLPAEAMVEEAARQTSRGTFSAFGVESAIGDSSTQQRILDEVQKIRIFNAGFEVLFKAMGVIQ